MFSFQKKKRATTRLEITLHGRVGAMNFRLIIWGVWNLMAKVSPLTSDISMLIRRTKYELIIKLIAGA